MEARHIAYLNTSIVGDGMIKYIEHGLRRIYGPELTFDSCGKESELIDIIKKHGNDMSAVITNIGRQPEKCIAMLSEIREYTQAPIIVYSIAVEEIWQEAVKIKDVTLIDSSRVNILDFAQMISKKTESHS